MINSSFSMVEIEEKLKQDAGGAYAGEVMETLHRHLGEVSALMDRGLGPDEFDTARQLNESIRKCIYVVDLIHNAMHGEN